MGDCHARGLPLCKRVQADATLSFYDFCSAAPVLLSLNFTSAPPFQPRCEPPTFGETRVSSTSISTHVGAVHHHQAQLQCHGNHGQVIQVIITGIHFREGVKSSVVLTLEMLNFTLRSTLKTNPCFDFRVLVDVAIAIDIHPTAHNQQ